MNNAIVKQRNILANRYFLYTRIYNQYLDLKGKKFAPHRSTVFLHGKKQDVDFVSSSSDVTLL